MKKKRKKQKKKQKKEEDEGNTAAGGAQGFFLDRVADGARGSIPFGKLVLGTILHFIFIINAVERRREKNVKNARQRRGGSRREGRKGGKERKREREKVRNWRCVRTNENMAALHRWSAIETMHFRSGINPPRTFPFDAGSFARDVHRMRRILPQRRNIRPVVKVHDS